MVYMAKEKFNISFKRDAAITGLAGVGYSKQGSDIKVNKKVVGSIDAPNWQTKDNFFRISLMIIKDDINSDGNPNCPWKRIRLKNTFESDADAREFIKRTLKKAVVEDKLFQLHGSDD